MNEIRVLVLLRNSAGLGGALNSLFFVSTPWTECHLHLVHGQIALSMAFLRMEPTRP